MHAHPLVFGDKATVECHIGHDCFDEVVERTKRLDADTFIFVTCTTVAKCWKPFFEVARKAFGDRMVTVHVPPGDAAKTWDTSHKVLECAFKHGCTKKTTFVAVGGGAVLNMVGFVASCLFRGSRAVYVPTTFLAMHDVITSLKTAICFADKKNNVGHYHAPALALVDTKFLDTLPQEELVSGLGELAKNALVLGGEHALVFTETLSKTPSLGRLTPTQLNDLVLLGIRAKMGVLKTDPCEKRLGMMFEYGHTVGHAMEKAYLETPGSPVLPHGCGVAYGMLFCSYVAYHRNMMTAKARARHDEVCRLVTDLYTLPQPLPNLETVVDKALHDSKRGLLGEAADEITDLILFDIAQIRKDEHPTMLSKINQGLLRDWWTTEIIPSHADVATMAFETTPEDTPEP